MPTFEYPAEQVLIDHGIFQFRSITRQDLIGCIACCILSPQRRDNPYAMRVEFKDCLESGVVDRGLYDLVDAGVLVVETVRTLGKAGAHQVAYRPTDSDLSKKFMAALERPDYCPRLGRDNVNL